MAGGRDTQRNDSQGPWPVGAAYLQAGQTDAKTNNDGIINLMRV